MQLFVILIIFVLKTILAKEIPTFIEDSLGVESRIINGEFAEPGQFPWQAYLKFRMGENNYACGGALICDSWVLTAAHCVTNASGLTIYLGSLNPLQAVDPGRVIVTGKRTLHHSGYEPIEAYHDVGLIQLNQRVTYTNKIRAIPLSSVRLGVNVSVTISGWGKTTHNGSFSARLKFVNMNTISQNECREYYGSIRKNTLCCKGQNKKNICGGDSGSPLVMKRNNGKFIHAGIASFTSEAGCESDVPSGYIRTESYTAWIKKVIGKTCQLPKAK